MAGDSNDAEHDVLADLVDELLGGAEIEQAQAITVRLATAATTAVRDALTDLAAMTAAADARVDVRVSDDGLEVCLTVADCSVGVAQDLAREFLRFCGALRIEIAELVSIVPSP